MSLRVSKFRLSNGRDFYILVTVFSDGRISFQILTGDDDDDQPFPVMTGRAQIDVVIAEFDFGLAEVKVLRIHLFDAEHCGVEAADTTDPRLLVFFPGARYYVLGDGPDVHNVETGKVVGRMPD